MSLRTKVLRGGVHLMLRQVLGVMITTVGAILLARALGPSAYGIYAAVFGIYVYLFYLSQWGLNIYLIRHQAEPQRQDYDQAFSLLLVLGLTYAALAILAIPLLERWIRLEGLGWIAAAVFAVLPVHLLSLVPQARLERVLDYRKVAMIELSGQLVTYMVALPLAYRGLGPWAPVGGLWAQQLLTFGLLYRVVAYRPRLRWEPARVRRMVRYGLGFAAAGWVWETRNLINPLVVGRYAGAETVGYVALAIRVTEQLSFLAMGPAWRLSIAVFGRLQADRTRLARAITEGMSLQLMVVGPLLVGFGVVAPWILPPLLGSRWLPMLEVYPFIALSYLSGAALNLHSYALNVLSRNWQVVVADLVHVVLFAGSALLLVPRLGLRGYGWAEVAALPSYVLVVLWVLIYIGRPTYTRAGVWFTVWAVSLFGWQLGTWAWASVLLPLLWRRTRGELLQTVTMIRRTIVGR
jgi:O-antigen/teichoic acid export membrane protein